MYHYKEGTNTSFGDQPHLTDPLDKKYVYVKESTNFKSAGEGVHASRTIQEGTAKSHLLTPCPESILIWKMKKWPNYMELYPRIIVISL